MVNPRIRRLAGLISGQAALEFLVTYGWAVLILLVVVAALAYFGVMNPSKILPERCNFGPEFHCVDYQVRDMGIDTDRFMLLIRNNGGEAIDVTSINVTDDNGKTYACTSPVPFPILGWNPEELKNLTWNGCTFAGLSEGKKGKILLTIKYSISNGGGAYERAVKGEIYTNILGS